ncbi:glycosyltransferase [Zafaria sp. Z1313]|uniref:glycosyltransferase n=1 Tax=Zafaria sp. Z1313 TaxID=3423202 RepID=UPI003D3022F4
MVSSTLPTRRLVIVVRADPVICGHSVEARNLAEAALLRGFDDVRILTWPIGLLEATGLPLKPADRILGYSHGITVERPEPVGDYKIPDGRHLTALTGRLVELFTDGVPTVAMSLYLMPHTLAVADALTTARATGLPVNVTTIAEAVGSDITNVVRAAVAADDFGAAARLLSAYLSQDQCVAVSRYTIEAIVEAAAELDIRHGTRFAAACRQRVGVSYPAIDTAAWTTLDPAETARVLDARGLEPGGYVLSLSRLMPAKGIDDLIAGFAASRAAAGTRLVVVGRGPGEEQLRAVAAASPAAERITFLTDVDDAEKPHIMAGSAAYVLATKPLPEFVETFGITLAESMLAGGGPVITTDVGGTLEAVGDTALVVPPGDPAAIARALDAALTLTGRERAERAARARGYALRFGRMRVFDALMTRAGLAVRAMSA